MRKLILIATLALVACLVPVAAMADNGSLTAVNADLAKLQTDVQTKHDAVVADAAKLQADATSLVGTSDKAAARATIKVDATKLTGDWKSLLSVCLADRQQLHTDVKAAIAASTTKADKVQVRLTVREANLTIKATNLQMRAAVAQARAAVVELRKSFHAAGQTAPAIATPPATTP